MAAFDSAQASRLARHWHPRALIAVGTDGERQLEQIRELDDALRGLPIFRCALRTHQFVERELSTVNYLIKPVTLEQLKQTLAKLGRRPRSVLVIDDDREILGLLPRMIHAIYPRCRVRVASDGTSGLEAMSEARPDAVLLDLLMPEMDGYGVLRAMHEADSLRDIPVVVVSAHGAEEDAVVAEELSLSRPGGLSLTELVTCLEENLNVLIDGAQTVPKPPGVTSASPAW